MGRPPKDLAISYGPLLRRDPVLRRIAAHGLPDPFQWPVSTQDGATNFAALVLHITSQQISTRAAIATLGRLRVVQGAEPNPQNIVALGADGLRAAGLSRAKAVSIVNLAEMQVIGAIDVEHMGSMTDDGVALALTSVRGIGPWTADMFLIHQLRRPDIFPAGDLGLRRAIQRAWLRPATLTVDETTDFARAWSPYRTYAAALLWHSLSLDLATAASR